METKTDRLVMPLRSTYSVHSFQDGSEALSEVEEMREIKTLQKAGEKALLKGNYVEALQYYSDALEIEDDNLLSLAGQAAVYLEMNNVNMAEQIVDKLMMLEPTYIQGMFLQSRVLKTKVLYKESIMQFLKVLEVAPKHVEYVNAVASQVAQIAAKICNLTDTASAKLMEMESYRKLCETGCFLYQNKMFDIAIEVLSSARKVATNQQGITMKLLLTLGNALAARKQKTQAISAYQECLSEAILAHDGEFQTKALINLSSLCLELSRAHDAIAYYKKLLDIRSDLLENDRSMPLYWNDQLYHAIHLNLSVAFKAIGRIREALEHALCYIELKKNVEESSNDSALAQAYCNAGTLYDMLSKPREAMEYYKKYLHICKRNGDKWGMAQAYGCMGSSYAQLGNAGMSVTMHEQHVALVKQLKDKGKIFLALEMFGDSYAGLENWSKAIETYENIVKQCRPNDAKVKSALLCKIGSVYRRQNLQERALVCFEEAEKLGSELALHNVLVLCKLNIALCLQESNKMQELERALGYLEFVIPVLEAKRCQHYEEDTFCPSQLNNQLKDCYNGLQAVYGKLDYKEKCLEYAEIFRRKEFEAYLTGSVSCTLCATGNKVSMEKMMQIVNEQNSVIVYYSLLSAGLLTWVIKPGEGLVRFYMKRNEKDSPSVMENVCNLLSQFNKELSNYVDIASTSCENRTLPVRHADFILEKKENLALSRTAQRKLIAEAFDLQNPVQCELTSDSTEKLKTPQKKLFAILLSPVYDLLYNLPVGSPVTFVPDGELCMCQFGTLEDWAGQRLDSRFRITTIPCLLALEKCIANEMEDLKRDDSITFDRNRARKGGPFVASLLEVTADAVTPAVLFSSLPPLKKSLSPRQNTKKVSNPRLVNRVGLSVVETNLRKHANDASEMHNATFLSKTLGTHTISTLCPRTETETDIIKSDLYIFEFQQISSRKQVSVIGSPCLKGKFKLGDKEWEPWTLRSAQQECEQIAQYCGTFADIGILATRQKFIDVLKTTTVLHIATFANFEKSWIAFTPDESKPPAPASILTPSSTPLAPASSQLVQDENCYLMSADDIATLTCVSKLVVLSCGRGGQQLTLCDNAMNLCSAFIAAGAQSVLIQLWPLPESAVQKFYYHFYMALYKERFITEAITLAIAELMKDNRFSKKAIWSAFALVGKDALVCIPSIQHAMLDQLIDKVEKEIANKVNKNPLNPNSFLPKAKSPDENYRCLQQHLSEVLSTHHDQLGVFTQLTDIIDEAVRRLQTLELAKRPQVLPSLVQTSKSSVGLLRILGFNLQSQLDNEAPFIIFPHTNKDNLLLPTFTALKSIEEMKETNGCLWMLSEVLPLHQTLICHLVDLLCITKHAAEVQLKVSDESVKKLWMKAKIRSFLKLLGFYQIGVFLHFSSTIRNRKLLSAALQLFLSLSTYKSATLLYKLEPTLLGLPQAESNIQARKSSLENTNGPIRLPTLTPLLLPRNQLQMTTPWLTVAEKDDEMEEKLKLAKSKSDVDVMYNRLLERTKTWHNISLSELSKSNVLSHLEMVKPQHKVKVISGSTASQTRIPVDWKPAKGVAELDFQRNLAHLALNERLEDMNTRHLIDIQKLYLPYMQAEELISNSLE